MGRRLLSIPFMKRSAREATASSCLRYTSRAIRSLRRRIGTLDTYEEEGLMTRGASLEKHGKTDQLDQGTALHVGHPHYRLMGRDRARAAPPKRASAPRGSDVKELRAGVLIRYTGGHPGVSAAADLEKAQIDRDLRKPCGTCFLASTEDVSTASQKRQFVLADC